MDSEFSYKEITAQGLAKFTKKWVTSEACGSAKYDVIKRVPTYKTWAILGTSIHFFYRAKNHVNTLPFSGYTKHGQFWRWSKMTMINHHNGKSTELVFSDWKFATGRKDHDFKSSALENQL